MIHRWSYILFLFLIFSACTKIVDETNSDEFLRFYGDLSSDSPADLQILADGDYLITGYSTVLGREAVSGDYNRVTSSNRQLCVLRTDAYGKQKWMATAGGNFGDVGNASIELDNGDIVSTGIYADTSSTGAEVYDVLLARFNSSGELLWSVHYGGKNNQGGTALTATPNGDFIVVGYTDAERAGGEEGNPLGTKDVYSIKISASGDSLWSQAYGFSGEDEGVKIIPDGDSRYMILARTEKGNTGQDQSDIFLFPINESGSSLWYNTVGNNEDEYPLDIEKLADGYLISGYALVGESAYGLVLKMPQNIFDSPIFYHKDLQVFSSNTFLSQIAVLDENTYATTGYYGTSGNEDIFLQYLDSDGKVLQAPESFGGSGSEYGVSLQATDHGYVLICGSSTVGSNSMIMLMKIKSDLTN